jgi:6-phosphofructokinase 1
LKRYRLANDTLLCYLDHDLQIYGVCGGYSGFSPDSPKPVIELDKATNLDGLQHRAGSILGCTAEGVFDLKAIMQFLAENNVSQLFVIGGDGSLRGAHRIALECASRNLNIAVAG